MKKVLITLILLMLSIQTVLAHPGREDKEGCHTCRTNCEDYGLQYGEYHCWDEPVAEIYNASNTASKENIVKNNGNYWNVLFIGGAIGLILVSYVLFFQEIDKIKN